MKIITHRIPELRRELPRKLIETKRKTNLSFYIDASNGSLKTEASLITDIFNVDGTCASPVGNLINIEV